MAKTELYRKPTPPGYLGGYNWRATTLGLLSLVVVSFLATEYIASKFQYQAALGPPLARNSRVALYEPFAWMIWGEARNLNGYPHTPPILSGGNDRRNWQLPQHRRIFCEHESRGEETICERR